MLIWISLSNTYTSNIFSTSTRSAIQRESQDFCGRTIIMNRQEKGVRKQNQETILCILEHLTTLSSLQPAPSLNSTPALTWFSRGMLYTSESSSMVQALKGTAWLAIVLAALQWTLRFSCSQDTMSFSYSKRPESQITLNKGIRLQTSLDVPIHTTTASQMHKYGG